MTDDELMPMRVAALTAAVRALATYFRDTLPKEEVENIKSRAEAAAREHAPSGQESATVTYVSTLFSRA